MGGEWAFVSAGASLTAGALATSAGYVQAQLLVLMFPKLLHSLPRELDRKTNIEYIQRHMTGTHFARVDIPLNNDSEGAGAGTRSEPLTL